ncbi:YciI family protein [Chitiniphilus purpureus]|uniref:YciI family protein n=1 Tax=Chitiniphilus purpureus TaxID=2981137 RepID=A0ABY6DMI2_9NEIS|nr:YciI family protein [Chitiniphilus sp. CD1]UXY14696.1 YciI family protein [Chitiniphilus sp. CD1]
MIYALLIHGSEDALRSWSDTEEAALMERHAQLRRELRAEARLGPVMRLAPGQACTLHADDDVVLDGPYAESKEQLLGLYLVDCPTLDAAIAAARRLQFDTGVIEIRPVGVFDPGMLPSTMPADER